MIGLPTNWDNDLYEADDEPMGSLNSLRRPSATASLRGSVAGAVLLGSESTSKAAELLRRAAEAPENACIGLGDQSNRLSARVDKPMMAKELGAGASAQIRGGAVIAGTDAHASMTDETLRAHGMLSATEPAHAGTHEVRAWTARAPRALGHAFSFRASVHGNIVALPVMQGNGVGGFRIKLLQLAPTLIKVGSSAASSAFALDEDAAGSASGSSGDVRTASGLGAAWKLHDGVGLLEAQRELGFADFFVGAAPGGVPLGLDIQGQKSEGSQAPEGHAKAAAAKALLDRYLQIHQTRSRGSLGHYAEETFELLGALFGEDKDSGNAGAKRYAASTCRVNGSSGRDAAAGAARSPMDCQRVPIQAALRQVHGLSAWLARVNSRTVTTHLDHVASSISHQNLKMVDNMGARTASESPDAVDARLCAAFHQLTANSVRGALQELAGAPASIASGEDHSGRVYFDRLATLVASCGGATNPGSQRRMLLSRQVAEWREQSVQELMGPSLWRLYSLLAGELDDVVGDALDWRTAFGMYLWYRSPSEKEAVGGDDQLANVVLDFEAAHTSRGPKCRFRPAPGHAKAQSIQSQAAVAGSNARVIPALQLKTQCETEPTDLQFNIIKSATGPVDWTDHMVRCEAMTHTSKPFDVALSWHVSVLLLALRGGSFATKEFQLLTQQYCQMLELVGSWEWAVYLSLFIRDIRARNALVRGLVQRNAAITDRASLKADSRHLHVQSLGLSCAWIWRAKAVRSEMGRDWPTAVLCWLKCGCAERALVITMGFLLSSAVVRHAGAPFLRGPTEAIALAPMAPEAKWLLSVFAQLEPSCSEQCPEMWGSIGHGMLQFMREWATPGTSVQYEPARLVRLYRECEITRRQVFGIPR